MKQTLRHVAFITVMSLFGLTGQAQAVCLSPVGDLDGSGITNVVDVQCQLLSILWTSE